MTHEIRINSGVIEISISTLYGIKLTRYGRKLKYC